MNCSSCQAPLKPDAAACLECGAVAPAPTTRPRTPEEYGQLLLKILKFDDAAVAAVAADPEATKVAAIVVCVGGASYAVGTFNPLMLIIMPVFLLVFMAIGVGVSHFIATCLGGKGQYVELFRVQGLTYALHLFSAVPVIGPLLGTVMWVLQMALLANAVKVVHKLPLPHAVAVVVIPGVIIFMLTVAFVMTVGFALVAFAPWR